MSDLSQYVWKDSDFSQLPIFENKTLDDIIESEKTLKEILCDFLDCKDIVYNNIDEEDILYITNDGSALILTGEGQIHFNFNDNILKIHAKTNQEQLKRSKSLRQTTSETNIEEDNKLDLDINGNMRLLSINRAAFSVYETYKWNGHNMTFNDIPTLITTSDNHTTGDPFVYQYSYDPFTTLTLKNYTVGNFQLIKNTAFLYPEDYTSYTKSVDNIPLGFRVSKPSSKMIQNLSFLPELTTTSLIQQSDWPYWEWEFYIDSSSGGYFWSAMSFNLNLPYVSLTLHGDGDRSSLYIKEVNNPSNNWNSFYLNPQLHKMATLHIPGNISVDEVTCSTGAALKLPTEYYFSEQYLWIEFNCTLPCFYIGENEQNLFKSFSGIHAADGVPDAAYGTAYEPYSKSMDGSGNVVLYYHLGAELIGDIGIANDHEGVGNVFSKTLLESFTLRSKSFYRENRRVTIYCDLKLYGTTTDYYQGMVGPIHKIYYDFADKRPK